MGLLSKIVLCITTTAHFMGLTQIVRMCLIPSEDNQNQKSKEKKRERRINLFGRHSRHLAETHLTCRFQCDEMMRHLNSNNSRRF